MRKMNTNPTLFESVITGTDEAKAFRGVEPNAIYELRYGPYFEDPEWDFGTVLIDTHVWSATFGCIVLDSYFGYNWPVKIEWSTSTQTLRVSGLWEDRVDEIPKWKLELWRVA